MRTVATLSLVFGFYVAVAVLIVLASPFVLVAKLYHLVLRGAQA